MKSTSFFDKISQQEWEKKDYRKFAKQYDSGRFEKKTDWNSKFSKIKKPETASSNSSQKNHTSSPPPDDTSNCLKV